MPKGIYIRMKPNHWIGKKHSKETKEKMSIAKKGRKLSKKHILALSGKNNVWHGVSRRGEKSVGWKGGRVLDSGGYIKIFIPKHPNANHQGYIKEQRLVMEKHLGRYLSPKEVVHHINGVKIDNRIENLKLFATAIEHNKFHHSKGTKFGINKEV